MTIISFFLILFAIIAIGVPVAVVFGGMAILPCLLDGTFPYTVEAAIRSMVSGLDSFTLLAVPLFMLSGIIMARGGISEKLFNFFAYFIGNKTAGMPCAVICTCMFYGAISGSSPATVSAVGAMTIPFLVSLGYDKVFATSIVTVAGGLGVIIPPSISYIGAALMAFAYIQCKKSGEDKERLAENYQKIHDKGFWPLFKESFAALLTPVIILGSIYGGIASPTEAAAISVVYAMTVSIFVYKTLKPGEIGTMFVEGAKTYVTILFIISAATAFGRAMTLLQYPTMISQGILTHISSKILIILVMNVILLVFGMIMDNIPNIMIFTPIFLPVATSIGMDPVHFGIMMTANLAIGMVTPPMGINLYVASSMTDIPVIKIAKACVPFLIAFLIALVLISYIPQLSLLLTGI